VAAAQNLKKLSSTLTGQESIKNIDQMHKSNILLPSQKGITSLTMAA